MDSTVERIRKFKGEEVWEDVFDPNALDPATVFRSVFFRKFLSCSPESLTLTSNFCPQVRQQSQMPRLDLNILLPYLPFRSFIPTSRSFHFHPRLQNTLTLSQDSTSGRPRIYVCTCIMILSCVLSLLIIFVISSRFLFHRNLSFHQTSQSLFHSRLT